MDFGRAISFVFQDPDWMKKGGIAALVFLIPLIGPIMLLGWGLEITRRVISLDPVPLPGWDDFSSTITKGFQAAVVSVVYLLPGIIFAIFIQVVSFGLAFMPVSDNNSNTLGSLAVIASLCLTCLMVILFVAGGFFSLAGTGILAATGELGAAFRFQEVFRLLRAAPGAYILVLVGIALANIVLAPLGTLACGIGVIITSAYSAALGGHLTGQAHTLAKAAKAGANL